MATRRGLLALLLAASAVSAASRSGRLPPSQRASAPAPTQCAYQPTGGCGAPKWAPRYGQRYSTYSYCFERCQVPWFLNNTDPGRFAGLVGIDHYWTHQGTDHCVNGTGLPNEWDAQDELTVAWKSVFPQMRVLQYRITTAVPYAMPVHDFIRASPDNAVAWPNGSLCQMWFSDNDTLGPDGKPKCAVDIRASAFNWANPAVRDWWVENAVKRVMTYADGAWIDGDGPDNGEAAWSSRWRAPLPKIGTLPSSHAVLRAGRARRKLLLTPAARRTTVRSL